MKINQESEEIKSQGNTSDKKKPVKRKLVFDSIVTFLIGVSPFIYYLYEVSPDGNVWRTFLFTYTSNGYEDLYVAFWIYLSKFVPLYLLSIWFISCKHWWYHIILIPISMYAFQLYNSLRKDTNIDELEIYWIIPILMIIAPLVYWIRIRLFDKLVHGIDLKAIERELDEYKEKERLEKIKKEEERKKRMSDIH